MHQTYSLTREMITPTVQEPLSTELAAQETGLKLFAIIVLYKMRPAESPSLRTLIQARDAAKPCCETTIFIADNTPGGQSEVDVPDGIFYEAFPGNPGLAPPYNRAILDAERGGCRWILTLDQDTCLPINFLTSMIRYVRLYRDDDRVAGFVPCIIDNGATISPFRFLCGSFPRTIRRGTIGIAKAHTSALNSASLLRISALQQVGGYDERFPLNNSDTAVFARLDRARKRLFVAGDIIVNHELAILRRERRMTPERYRQLLIDEFDFWNSYMPLPARIERIFRLLGRLVRGYLTAEDARFRDATRDEIRLRLSSLRLLSKRNGGVMAASVKRNLSD